VVQETGFSNVYAAIEEGLASAINDRRNVQSARERAEQNSAARERVCVCVCVHESEQSETKQSETKQSETKQSERARAEQRSTSRAESKREIERDRER
jgi:methylmalonyl-CoA mutase N-terminal domain/subunit